jgi:hypothetical protein
LNFVVLPQSTIEVDFSLTGLDSQGLSDDLMSRLSTLLSTPLPSETTSVQQKAYVTYTISSLSPADAPLLSLPKTISLLESCNLITAAGTTGFRTWEPSLHLGVYLSSPDCAISIRNKNILELGAGTGYLSILCVKHLGAAHVISTDGSEAVVADLPTNFYLNGLQDSSKIMAQELRWGQALLGTESETWNHGRKIDVLLGADVAYYDEGIPALVATMMDVSDMFPEVLIVLSLSVRNEKTLNKFFQSCESGGFVVDQIDCPELAAENQEGPFYGVGCPIRLYKIKRKTT